MWQKVIVLESRHGVIADEGWRVCQSSTGHAMEQPDHTNQRTNSNGNSKYWNICTVSKFHPKQDWKSTTIEVLDVEARQGIHNMFDLTTRVPRGLVLLVKSCTNKHKAGKDCRQEEKGGDRGWDDWTASPARQTLVWANSRKQWRTGKPGLLQSVESQRVGPDWVTEQLAINKLTRCLCPGVSFESHLQPGKKCLQETFLQTPLIQESISLVHQQLACWSVWLLGITHFLF